MANIDYDKIQALIDSVNEPIVIDQNDPDVQVDESHPDFLALLSEVNPSAKNTENSNPVVVRVGL